MSVDVSGVVLDGPALLTLKVAEQGSVIVEVPSMGLPLCPAAAAIADVYRINPGSLASANGEWLDERRLQPCSSPNHFLEISEFLVNTEFGFQLTYPTLPDGYLVQEGPASLNSAHRLSLFLVREKEWQDYRNSPAEREGPPQISIDVFANTRNQWSGQWARTNPAVSHLERATTAIEEVVVADANAVHYAADGLYPLDTYVVAHGGFVFLLSAMLAGDDQDLGEDFREMIRSLRFIPTQEESL